MQVLVINFINALVIGIQWNFIAEFVMGISVFPQIQVRGVSFLCRVRLHVRSTDVAIQITYVKRSRPDCKLLIEPGFTCACVHLLTNSFHIQNLKNSPPDVQQYLYAPCWLQWIKFRTQNYDSDDSGGPHSGRQQPVKSLHPTRRILKVNYSALNGRNSFLSHVIWPPSSDCCWAKPPPIAP